MRILICICCLFYFSCQNSNPQEKSLVDEKPSLTKTQLKGIDVSHHSGDVDWDLALKEDVKFVFCKASEGDDWQDPMFSSYFEQLKERGVFKGAYHFYVVGDDPEVQADNFIKIVSLEPGDLPPVIDIETMHNQHDPQLAKDLRVFVDKIEKYYHKKPILYTGPRFWNQHIHKSFSDYDLWVAEYEVPEPQLPHGWEKWAFWQINENQVVPGISKGVDINLFNGTLEDLHELVKNAEIP